MTYRWLKLVLAIAAVVLPASAADLAVLQNGFTIRHERREILGTVTRLYTSDTSNSYVDIPTAQIDHFEKDLSPPPAPAAPLPPPKPVAPPPKTLADMVNSASDAHNIDPDLINSVIHAESNFNPRAVSPKGARGLMQLMPKTANQLGVNNTFDPNSNVDGGTKYLQELLQRYNYDMVKALAAYNAGPERVDRYHGVPPYYETRAYVARIVRDFNNKKLAARKAAEAAAKTNPGKPGTRSKPVSKSGPAPVKQATANSSSAPPASH
ncbi:MAG TPA: lytic transglycosylase domain-containing protein [Terriglobales bacterium]|nr:lytic transglycosylase domain-containing protein [Terriglobales bacterium]